MFACGTAAVITPIASLHNDEGDVVVGSGETGEMTAALRKALMDIQYGRAEDTHGWLRRVPERVGLAISDDLGNGHMFSWR